MRMILPEFKKLRKIAGETIVRYRMISEGDRILCGLSGGKDSFVLVELLHQLQKAAPVPFEIAAVTFDPGFPGFNTGAVSGYCREKGWEHHIIKMQIADIIEEKSFEHAPCVLCSRLRRGKLYGLAKELKCNKLALGHHLDDIIVSFIMSLCRGQGVTTMAPVVPQKGEGSVTVIRPMALVPEKLIAACAESMQIPRAGLCRYKEQLDDGDRRYFAQTVAGWEKRIPDLRSNIARSLAHPEVEHLLCPPENN